MKILYARFTGYIGFYAKMGLKKLEIDFSKSKSNIVLIVGMNGSGKSTLLRALSIFPDSSSDFMDDCDGEKLIRLTDKGNLYEINIISPHDPKGGRKTNKAFISLNGTELNPNGNVSSYKEIVMDEFELDPNYISLSMLSSTDRGLGDKRPAERKRFVGSVIDNLVTYNNIYKTLNKKSLLYKSHINTIHTKIQSTGDRAALESTLAQLKRQRDMIKNNIMDLNNKIVTIQAKCSFDEEETKRIQTYSEQLHQVEETINTIQMSVDSFIHDTKIQPEEVEAKYVETKTLHDSYKEKYTSYKDQWTEKSNLLAQIENTINQLEANLPNIESDDRNLSEVYSKSTNELKTIKKELAECKIPLNVSLVNPLSDLISKYESFINRLDAFYEGMDPESISFVLHQHTLSYLNGLKAEEEKINRQIDQNDVKIQDLRMKLSKVKVIEDRPSKCKIDSCPFIKEAVEINKKYGIDNLLEEITVLQTNQSNLSTLIQQNVEKVEFYHTMLPKKMELDALRNDHLILLRLESIFGIDSTDFDVMIEQMNRFNDRRDPKRFREALILLQKYDTEKKNNDILKVEYQGYQEKIQLINSTNATLKDMKSQRDTLHTEIADAREQMNHFDYLVGTLSNDCAKLEGYHQINMQMEAAQKEKAEIVDKLSIYEKKSSKALESIGKIQEYEAAMNEANNSLQPIENQITDINGMLVMLAQYYDEYNRYNESFQIIETLKKYCSPTGGGIQTFFMQLYMSKTLELSNQILSMLFGGEYRLADFVINDNEFRIPFVGSGMMVDDISSGSNSQICMMGMVINLVLLHQASTKYNIAFLDEIDGGLDHRNRFEFIQTLRQTVPMLGIEQLFMISHSMEADTSSVDIIKLMNYNDFEDSVDMGNVIYDYKNE